MSSVIDEMLVEPEDDTSFARTLDEQRDDLQKQSSFFQSRVDDTYLGGNMIAIAGGTLGAAAGPVGALAGYGSVAGVLLTNSSRKHFKNLDSTINQLQRVENHIDKTVFFDGEEDYSHELPGDQDITDTVTDLIQNSEDMRFEDFYFPEETSLHDFGDEPALSLYERLLKEPSKSSLRHGGDNEHVDHFLTVEQAEGEVNQYVLDVGVNYELAGRFTGYTDQDLEPLLEAGEDDYNTNIRF